MNEDILDKKLVYINSSNSMFLSSSTYDFYYDIQESIRNVVYIKIMKCEVVLNPSGSINGVAIQDTDPVFVGVKGLNRMYTNIYIGPDSSNLKQMDYGKNVKCFEQISLNISDKFGANATPNKYISFKTEYTATGCTVNDINTIVLDPAEPILRRFDIQLYDKNYNIIQKSDIKVFNMILCIYSKRKKSTMN
jgi:hypothetical protein